MSPITISAEALGIQLKKRFFLSEFYKFREFCVHGKFRNGVSQ